MKKITLLILLLSGLNNSVAAQGWDWVFIPTAEESDTSFITPSALETDGYGNVYINCISSCPSISFGDYGFEGETGLHFRNYLVKFNGSGDVIWAKGTSEQENVYIRSIAVDTPGNLFTTGYFSGTYLLDGITLETSENSDNAFIAKTGPNGNTLWALQATASGEGPHYIRADGMALDPDGNIYIAGRMGGDTATFGAITIAIEDETDFFIAKYDPNGTALWVRAWQNHSTFVGPNALACDSSGNLYICGNYNNTLTIGDTVLGTEGTDSTFLIKYGPDGSLIWSNSHSGSESAVLMGLDMGLDNQNNVYTTGYFSSDVSFNGIMLSNADMSGTNDAFVAKYDSNGIIQWAKAIGGSPDAQDSRSIYAADGNIYLSGTFESAEFPIGDTPLINEGSTSSYFAKLDTDGNYIWAQQIEGESVFQNFMTIDSATNSLYALGIFDHAQFEGQTFISNISPGNLYFAKYDMGDLSTNELRSNKTLLLYPNPVTDYLKVSGNGVAETGSYIITDMSGRVIMTGSNENSINVSSLKPGVYIINIDNSSAKFIKE
ncbi:T9SS type A sorting domain-containing protein [uncultured Flavobacterium sp.]|uniref:T9SS type A sorting domain-containing protein n=1 Tax=uncultured Flavobacterium sp. TaxID=165435 RepID=UPI0025D6AB9F|nr:T9SS type A sorting domain-containing protein [uncultured Flavobacterium sp.]